MKEKIKNEIERIINIHFSENGEGKIFNNQLSLHDNFIDPVRLGARLVAYFHLEASAIRLVGSSTLEDITKEVINNLPIDYQI